MTYRAAVPTGIVTPISSRAGETDQAACRVGIVPHHRERQAMPRLAANQRLRSLLDELRADVTELG